MTFFENFKQKRDIVRRFRDQGAANIEFAKPLSELYPEQSPVIRKMIRDGIIKQVGIDDEFYLDEKRLLEKNMSSVKWGMAFVLILIILLFKLAD